MLPAGVLRLVVLLFSLTLPLSPITARHQARRALHQPFLPQDYSPPFQPPSSSPQTQPQLQQPKYPFSSSSSPSPPQPFFPFYQTPPPPPATAVATFPANISSLLLPQPTSHPHNHSLAIAAVVSLLSAALIAALAAFLYYRKNCAFRSGSKISRTDDLCLYPPTIATSDGGVKPRNSVSTSSEFLYLGKLVNSRGIYEESEDTGCGGGQVRTSASPRQNHGSPELMPLPPLPRHNSLQGQYRYAELDSVKSEEEDDAEEEFFSARGSSGGKENPSRTGSCSRKMFENVNAEKHGVKLKTSPYLSSYSGSPTLTDSNGPSPLVISSWSLNSKSPDSITTFPDPPRPLPPRRITPTSLSLSSSSSPLHKDSGNIQTSPPTNPVISVPGMQFQTGNKISLGPYPPPSPPLPPKFWEIPARTRLTKEPNLTPPVLVTPSRPTGFQIFAPNSSSDQLNCIITTDGICETPKPKLKPLHWDKVRSSSDRAMVWDQIKSSSFQLNEEMIETLFMANNPNSVQKDNGGRRPIIPSPNQENQVLDPKKSQNIAILLRALNVTIDDVCDALLEGNADTLGTELLESLLKMAPTEEEEIKLKEFKDESPYKLGPAEKFLKAVLDIPFAFRRIDAMLYIASFDSENEYLKGSFDTLQVHVAKTCVNREFRKAVLDTVPKAACEELKTNRMFLKLLEAVLKTGNRMNVGTNRGDAHAFKLDTLLKLVDVKGTDGKTTLLHFVVQEIIKAEGFRLVRSNARETDKTQVLSLTDDLRFKKLGLRVVSSLSGELSNVKKAAAMDSEVLRNEASKLVRGIEKIECVVKLIEEIALKTNSWKFSESMNEFLCKAEEEIIRTQAQETVALSMVRELTEYFHGNSAIEGAHPFRIFTVVRDFLGILDQVCKEVGKINERAIVGSTHQFPVLPTTNAHQSSSL